MIKAYEIVTYDSVILLRRPQEVPSNSQYILSPIEFAKTILATNCNIGKWMETSFDCMILQPMREWRSGGITLSLTLHPQGIELIGNDLAINLINTSDSTNDIVNKINFFHPSEFQRVAKSQNGRNLYPWMRRGYECRVLMPGQEWQQGRVKLAFIFYPDQNDESSIESTGSSLDDIRKIMTEAN
jgi:KGK domain